MSVRTRLILCVIGFACILVPIFTARDSKPPTEYLERPVAAQEPRYNSGIKKITDIPGERCAIYELKHEGHMFLITQCTDSSTMVHSQKVY